MSPVPEGAGEEGRERRLARNEVFFREANELREREAAQRAATAPPIICECSQSGCLERISVTREEYEHARSRGDWFIVAPGHEDPTIETVVERHQDFLVVEKIGVASAIARNDDPREPG